jgi:hypothetical protein
MPAWGEWGKGIVILVWLFGYLQLQERIEIKNTSNTILKIFILKCG